MSQKLKVVTIGGGSSYTPELLEGFLKRYHELPISELWLVDVAEGQEKLDIIHALCQRMVEKAGVPMKVYKTLDRRAALEGAHFVTTQLRVGQLKAREKDERIPLSHGYLGQETNGAGGLFKGLRTIPVIFDIVKDVQEICPDAWIINFTNPAGMVTEAVYRHTNFKRFIGVCNIPIGMKMFITDVLQLTPEEQAAVCPDMSKGYMVAGDQLTGGLMMAKFALSDRAPATVPPLRSGGQSDKSEHKDMALEPGRRSTGFVPPQPAPLEPAGGVVPAAVSSPPTSGAQSANLPRTVVPKDTAHVARPAKG